MNRKSVIDKKGASPSNFSVYLNGDVEANHCQELNIIFRFVDGNQRMVK